MSKGSDPGDSPKALAPTLSALFEILEGNALVALVRPAFDAVQQVVEVWSKIEEAAKSLQNVLAPPKPKPHVGIVSGIGGISMLTRGNVSAAGQTVTLVAAGASDEPDARKFIPGIEDLIEWIEHANDKIHEWTKNPMWDAIDSKLKGNLNLVSSANTTLLAGGPLRMVAQDGVAIYGRSATVQVADGLKLGAHTAALQLHGKTVEVGTSVAGAGAGAKKQAATESVAVNATTGTISLLTTSTGAWLDEAGKRASLGSRTAVNTVDVAKAHLSVEPTKLVAGDADGKLSIDAGEVSLRSKSKLNLSANSLNDIETSGGSVKINGKLDVGGALTVMGAPGGPVIDVAEKLKATADESKAAAEKATLVAQHAALKASITALDTALETARLALVKVRDNEGFIWFGQDLAIVAAEGVVDALATQRDELESKRAGVEATVRGRGWAASLV
ncbi:MAG: hypothetical protein FJ096_16800 [Deltaproteobacteria bacterium]|nr:hypothetical protein [Deltaproteobacteria bacterium]